MELDDRIHRRVSALCERGDHLVEQGDADAALLLYEQALSLLPRPVEEWEAATWIFTALGDVRFQQGRYEDARTALEEAMRCPGGIGNPFIHLRLGQSCLELRDIDRAKDELARAYMGGGDEIFSDEAPKYLTFIKEVLRPREDI